MTSWEIHTADILDWAAGYDGPKFHALLSDPPYELKFMSRAWDASGISFQPETWAALAEHLHPGAFGMAFASSRGWHRLAVAIEDSGMIIQPSIFGWATGQSFPKATRIDTQIDAHGGKSIGWFGPWLRKWRQGQGITQKELAKHFPSKTGGLTGCVANWELGHNLPTLKQFNKLVEVLDLPFQTLEEIKQKVIGNYIAPDGKERGGVANRPMNIGGYQHGDRKEHLLTAPATSLACAWAGHRYGGQILKNALEPIIVFQKPWQGKRLDCIVETGAGSMWINGSRVGVGQQWWERGDAPDDEITAMMKDTKGRWPSNFTLTHSAGCRQIGTRRVRGTNPSNDKRAKTSGSGYEGGWGVGTDKRATSAIETVTAWDCVPECPVRRLGEMSGEKPARQGNRGPMTTNGSHEGWKRPSHTWTSVRGHNDTGTAARFYFQADWSYEIAERLAMADPVLYCAKASRKERDVGLENMPLVSSLTEQIAEVRNQDRYSMSLFCKICGKRNDYGCGCNAGWEQKPQPGLKRKVRNPHPTIKPIALTRWLATLLLPPPEYAPRRLLIPFSGSGSEGIGAGLAGWEEMVLIDLLAENNEIAEARLQHWLNGRQLELNL